MNDAEVGASVKRLRELAGFSQSALASAMVERGFTFSQAAVWSVENGTRPLRLTEAIALSEILGISIQQLCGQEEVASSVARAVRLERALRLIDSAIRPLLEPDP